MTAATPVTWMPERLLIAPGNHYAGPASPANFSTLLKTEIAALTRQVDRGSELLMAHVVGEPVSPHDLVMAMEQAKLSMQLAIEVRNRLVDAYQELTRLQV